MQYFVCWHWNTSEPLQGGSSENETTLKHDARGGCETSLPVSPGCFTRTSVHEKLKPVIPLTLSGAVRKLKWQGCAVLADIHEGRLRTPYLTRIELPLLK